MARGIFVEQRWADKNSQAQQKGRYFSDKIFGNKKNAISTWNKDRYEQDIY